MATTVEQYPLEKRKIVKKTLNASVKIIIVFIIIPLWLNVFFFQQFMAYLLILDALFVAFPLVEWVYQTEYYKKYFYDIRSDFLVIKKGVITPREVILPYDKMQDVYVDQDFYDRVFGLFDVHLSTVGLVSIIQLHVDGVSLRTSELLKTMFSRRTEKASQNKA